jgi:hypothetical protein
MRRLEEANFWLWIMPFCESAILHFSAERHMVCIVAEPEPVEQQLTKIWSWGPKFFIVATLKNLLMIIFGFEKHEFFWTMNIFEFFLKYMGKTVGAGNFDKLEPEPHKKRTGSATLMVWKRQMEDYTNFCKVSEDID